MSTHLFSTTLKGMRLKVPRGKKLANLRCRVPPAVNSIVERLTRKVNRALDGVEHPMLYGEIVEMALEYLSEDLDEPGFAERHLQRKLSKVRAKED